MCALAVSTLQPAVVHCSLPQTGFLPIHPNRRGLRLLATAWHCWHAGIQAGHASPTQTNAVCGLRPAVCVPQGDMGSIAEVPQAAAPPQLALPGCRCHLTKCAPPALRLGNLFVIFVSNLLQGAQSNMLEVLYQRAVCLRAHSEAALRCRRYTFLLKEGKMEPRHPNIPGVGHAAGSVQVGLVSDTAAAVVLSGDP